MSQVLSVSFLWFLVFSSLWSIIITPLILLPTFNLCCPSVRIYYCPPFFQCDFFHEWHDRYDFSITLSTCGTLWWLYNWYASHSVSETACRFCCCLFAWESCLWPFHVSCFFYAFPTPPTRWVVCPLNIFSKFRMLIIVKSAARRVGLVPAHRQCSTYF